MSSKHMKRSSIPSVIGETQMKATKRYRYTPIRTAKIIPSLGGRDRDNSVLFLLLLVRLKLFQNKKKYFIESGESKSLICRIDQRKGVEELESGSEDHSGKLSDWWPSQNIALDSGTCWGRQIPKWRSSSSLGQHSSVLKSMNSGANSSIKGWLKPLQSCMILRNKFLPHLKTGKTTASMLRVILKIK